MLIQNSSLVHFISTVLNIPEKSLEGATNLAQKNVDRAIVAFKLMGINVTKDEIQKVLTDENLKLQLLSKFYKLHPDIIVNQKHLLFTLILNRKVNLKEISTEDLNSFLKQYSDSIDEEYKIEIAREIINRYIDRLDTLPDKNLLYILLLKKAIDIKKIPSAYLNELLDHYSDKIDEEHKLSIAREIASRDVSNLEELPKDEQIKVMSQIPVDALLRAPISLYESVFQALHDRFGEDMWLHVINNINKDNLAMITLLLTAVEKDFSLVLASQILTRYESILDKPFRQIISVIAGNKVKIQPETLKNIITIYSDDKALLQILKSIYDATNINLHTIYQMLPDRPEFIVELATELNLSLIHI